MFTRATDKRIRSSMNIFNLDYCDILREAGIHIASTKYQTNMLISRNMTGFVSKGQNMLHKLNLDTNSMIMSYWRIKE